MARSCAACRCRSGPSRRTKKRARPRSSEKPSAFEFFSDRVGPFAYEKLAHVEAAGMGGGMESATNIFYGEKGVSAGNTPVVHETAHQWFGDSVTESDWNDVWLSEGFATYFTLLYTSTRRPRRLRRGGAQAAHGAACRAIAAARRSFTSISTSSAGGPEHPARVSKGSWVRTCCAADRHRRVLARHPRLYRDHMNGLASTDDLRQRWRRRRDRISGPSSRSG